MFKFRKLGLFLNEKRFDWSVAIFYHNFIHMYKKDCILLLYFGCESWAGVNFGLTICEVSISST